MGEGEEVLPIQLFLCRLPLVFVRLHPVSRLRALRLREELVPVLLALVGQPPVDADDRPNYPLRQNQLQVVVLVLVLVPVVQVVLVLVGGQVAAETSQQIGSDLNVPCVLALVGYSPSCTLDNPSVLVLYRNTCIFWDRECD